VIAPLGMMDAQTIAIIAVVVVFIVLDVVVEMRRGD